MYENPDKVIEKSYGVWLCTPLKNATKFHARAKWLRNTSDGSSQWMKTSTQGSMSTAGHGGGKDQARFMEVDRVVRENQGDNGGVAIKMRDSKITEGDLITH